MKPRVLSNTYTKPERAMYLTGLLGQNIIYNVIAVDKSAMEGIRDFVVENQDNYQAIT